MGFRVLLSVAMLLSSCLIINVFGSNDVYDNVSSSQSPHHAPSYQPAVAPSPHHHHHHHHHHHKLASPPIAHSPSIAPVQPPTKVPVHAPTKAPVHAPTKEPVHAPTKAPAHTPTKAPVHTPTKAPVHPPSISPAPVGSPIPARKLVAVQGVVYCKACKYKGVDTLLGATPLQGAEVLLRCNNTKYPLRVKGTSDKNGYFFIKPPKTLTTYGSHTCRVTLLTSPMAICNKATDLHAGVKGSLLVPKLPSPDAHPLPYDVFTVGPFAFEPSPKTSCAHE